MGSRNLVAQDGGGLTGQRAAVTMHQGDTGRRHLPFTALASELPHRFDENEDAIHARMDAGQPASVSDHRRMPPRRNAAILHEGAALSRGAQAYVFEEQQ